VCVSFHIGLLFINFSSFKPDTENNANFDAVRCIKQTRQLWRGAIFSRQY